MYYVVAYDTEVVGFPKNFFFISTANKTSDQVIIQQQINLNASQQKNLNASNL